MFFSVPLNKDAQQEEKKIQTRCFVIKYMDIILHKLLAYITDCVIYYYIDDATHT